MKDTIIPVTLSLQGSMAVGKSTAARYVQAHASHIHVCPEDTGDVIARVRAAGLDKTRYEDYIEIQRLWLRNEIRRWEEARRHPVSLMDMGAEEIIFYTLHYPGTMGLDWNVSLPLKEELAAVQRCMPRRTLFLDAPEEEVRRRKEGDPTRRRSFFEHSVTRLLPIKRQWLLSRPDVDVLNVSCLSPEETGRAVLRWANRWSTPGVSPVQEDNLAAAAHVHAESWRASHADICSPAFIAAHDDHRQAAYIRTGMQQGKQFFLLETEKAAGVVAVEDNTISDLYVLPESQGQGIGSALLEYAVRQCEGTPRLTVLNTNSRARTLYLRFGFAESGKSFPLKNGLYEIEMVYSKKMTCNTREEPSCSTPLSSRS